MNTYPRFKWILTMILIVIFTGCQAPPQQRPSLDATQVLDFDVAISEVVNSLVLQLNEPSAGILGQIRDQVKDALSVRQRKPVVLDHIIDGSSGLHTSLAERFELKLLPRLNAVETGINAAVMNVDNLTQADLLVTGTIVLERQTGSTTSATSTPARARVVIINRRSGKVVAQASALIRNDGFSLTPNRLEQDSPVVLLDEIISSKFASVKAPVGQPADPRYLSQLKASALIDAGSAAYANQDYRVAAEHFRAAQNEQLGAQLRALTGSYLASVKLNLMDRAEQFFGQMVAYGIRERKLGVKFLFRPGSTDFWQSSQISSLYGMWIRQAARGVNNARACLELVGHASQTGTEAFNDKLSEQRALLIRDRMIQEVPALTSRVSARGVGFRETIVGTGTDDAGDAEDRRVAFSFRDCSAK